MNGPICFVLGSIVSTLEKRIKEHGEEFSVTLYTIKNGEPTKKVEENTFYPSP